jgi:hypothetical protein
MVLGVLEALWDAGGPGLRYGRLSRTAWARKVPKGATQPLGDHRAHGDAKVDWAARAAMGPMEWISTVVDHRALPPSPFGQLRDGEVDRAARVPKGQRGGGNRCPPRRRVSFFQPTTLTLSTAAISRCHQPVTAF